jgi:hypothetical protein
MRKVMSMKFPNKPIISAIISARMSLILLEKKKLMKERRWWDVVMILSMK